MGLKTKVKSYSFWVSLASAVILILKLVGQKFGFAVDEGLISDLFTSLCAILVLMGIIVVPSPSSLEQKNNSSSVADKILTNDICIKNNIADNNLKNDTTEILKPAEIVDEKNNNENSQNNENEVKTETIQNVICEALNNLNNCETVIISSDNIDKNLDATIEQISGSLSETMQNENQENNGKMVEPSNFQSKIENCEPLNMDISNSLDMSKKLEDFIDKVCLKRNELSKNTIAFVEFLQNEINQINEENK